MSDATTEQPGVDIGRYWTVLVSRWQTVAAGVILGLLIAGSYLLIVPTTYVAVTTLSVLPITSDPYAANRNNNNLLDMNAEATTARSFKVAELAAKSGADQWNPIELRESTEVAASTGSSTMTISVAADSEEKARSGAGAMADAYIKTRSDQVKLSIDNAMQKDQERISSLRQSLNAALKRLASAKPGSPAAAEASADQQIISLQLSALFTRARSLEGVDSTGGVILNPASATQITREPARITTLATGLAAGLLLGIIAAFVTHSRRKAIHSANDLRREFDIETLGVLDDDSAPRNAAAVAQRLLRFASRDGAQAVSLVFDSHVPGHTALTERILAELQAAGSTVVTADPSLADAALSNQGGRLTLIPVAPDASTAARLQALRLSDVSVLVVRTGATRMRDLAAVIGDAAEMGSHIIGAALVSHRPGRYASAEEAAPGRAEDTAATTPV